MHEAMVVVVKSAHDARIYNGNDTTSVSYSLLNTRKRLLKFVSFSSLYSVVIALSINCGANKVFWKGVWGITFCSQKVFPSL